MIEQVFSTVINSNLCNSLLVYYYETDKFIRKCFLTRKKSNKIGESLYNQKNDSIYVDYTLNNEDYTFVADRRLMSPISSFSSVLLLSQEKRDIENSVDSIFCGDEDITSELKNVLGPCNDFHSRITNNTFRQILPEKIINSGKDIILFVNADIVIINDFDCIIRNYFEKKKEETYLL